jgi:TolB-like protein/DNA-binding winged helix-turn-helix (wHTH) protein/Tfp pilus assembly protein PilF
MSTKSGQNPDERAPKPVWQFCGFTLDPNRQVLVCGSEAVRLRSRTYDVLAYLVAHPGRLISKTELIDSVWQDVAVTDDSLVQSLSEIRRALGDAQAIIKTIRGRGYVFEALVELTPAASVTRPHADAAEPLALDTSGQRPTARVLWWSLVAASLLVAGSTIVWSVARSGRAASSGSAVPIRSLAVLSLENLSADHDQDYFADGLTDELITQLAKITELRVIARTSVLRYKGTDKSLAAIGRELDVDAVVEGSVARSNERVRVTAQVIQVHPEQHLWADRFDRSLGDIVILQGELAREIAQAIRVTLTPQEQKRFASIRPVDQREFEARLKGRYYWAKRTEEGTKKAIEYFQEALALDPNDALALTGLADSYTSLAIGETLQEAMPPKEAFPKARAAARRAIEIDDTLGEAHASLAHINFQYDRDWSGSEQEFRRAIALTPNYASAHHWFALHLMWMKRPDEALREIRRARELDPLSLVINANFGFVLAGAGRYPEAIAQCRTTIDMDRHFAHAHYRLGQIYNLIGSPAEAIIELRQAVATSGGSPRATAELGLAYALHGDRRQALDLIDDLQAQSNRRYISPFDMAVIYGGLSDRAHTLRWLQQAYDDGAPSLSLLNFSPAFNHVRSDPAFAALVERVGVR